MVAQVDPGAGGRGAERALRDAEVGAAVGPGAGRPGLAVGAGDPPHELTKFE